MTNTAPIPHPLLNTTALKEIFVQKDASVLGSARRCLPMTLFGSPVLIDSTLPPDGWRLEASSR